MSSASLQVASPASIVADDRVVLPCVNWETYKRLLSDDEERRVPRMTHDQGVPELVTPSLPYEKDALTIARASAALSSLTSDVLNRFMAESRTLRRTVWIRQLREWARSAFPSS